MLYFVITSLIGSLLILLFTFYSIVSSLVTPLPFLTQSIYLCVCLCLYKCRIDTFYQSNDTIPLGALPEKKKHLEMIKDCFGIGIPSIEGVFVNIFLHFILTYLLQNYIIITPEEESIFFTSITYTCLQARREVRENTSVRARETKNYTRRY